MDATFDGAKIVLYSYLDEAKRHSEQHAVVARIPDTGSSISLIAELVGMGVEHGGATELVVHLQAKRNSARWIAPISP